MTKPPKAKFALCVCVANGFYVWINSKPRPHGHDQMPLSTGCHELVEHDSFLDLSRVVIHPEYEMDDAREFPMISPGLRDDIVAFIEAGLMTMPPRHASIVLASLKDLTA